MKKYVQLLGIMFISKSTFSQRSSWINIKDNLNQKSFANVSIVMNKEGKTSGAYESVLFLPLELFYKTYLF